MLNGTQVTIPPNLIPNRPVACEKYIKMQKFTEEA
jgi:hypothetical protein